MKRHKFLLFIIAVAITCLSTILISLPLIAQTNIGSLPSSELRGVWLTNIDSDVLFDKKRLKNALQDLNRLNFNTVYPTVWNWGYTLYPSKVAAKAIGRSLDPTPGLQGRDMLREVVKEGHQLGLKVIPWFEFGFMAPADALLAKKHPEWLTKRLDGTLIEKEGRIHDRVWLNPWRPDVQSFILSLIEEIVQNYDIDGIQFDDHFGLPSDFGYDDYTVKLYQAEHHGEIPPQDPQNPKWVEWRSGKITDFLYKVFKTVKAKKHNCLVSIAPNPHRFSYPYSLADWKTWERMGIVEDIVLQVYRNDLNVFNSELEYPEVVRAKSHIPVSVGIVTGLKHRKIPLAQIESQVQQVRDRHFAGVSFFFYESLWNLGPESLQERQKGFQKIFSHSQDKG